MCVPVHASEADVMLLQFFNFFAVTALHFELADEQRRVHAHYELMKPTD